MCSFRLSSSVNKWIRSFKKIRSKGIEKPVIMLTGQKDEHTIVELLKEGANDYISKAKLTPKVLRISIEKSQQIYKIKKEKFLSELALKESKFRLLEAQEIACLGHWEYDFETKELILSEVAQSILVFQCMHLFVIKYIQRTLYYLLHSYGILNKLHRLI